MKNTTFPNAMRGRGFAAAVFLVAAACAAPLRADDAEWTERRPVADTFVNYNSTAATYGSNEGIVVGNGREGVLKFDVSDLAGVTAAKVRFRITQCGTAEGAVWPLFFRVMRDTDWNEASLAWNSLPDEFRVAPSPALLPDDPSLAGYAEIRPGSSGTWQEVDVTEAVKAAAASGVLSLHVYTSWGSGSADTTPLAFASKENSDATLAPVLAFQGAEALDAASERVLWPTDDTFVFSGNASGNYGSEEYDFLDKSGKRETFMKFDISGIRRGSVDSAVLVLRMYWTSVNWSAGNNVQYERTPKSDWSESELTWNNAAELTGTAPGAAWPSTVPEGAVRGPSAEANQYYSIDIAPLLDQALAAGDSVLSVHIWRNPGDGGRYMAFWSKEAPDTAYRPRLLVQTAKPAAILSRKPAAETFVSDYSAANMDKSFSGGTFAQYVQIGASGKTKQYATMLFDPAGLENAEFVRFRIRAKNNLAKAAGILRVAAWTTDGWNDAALTYNTVSPWFPQPETVAAGTAIDGEIASFDSLQPMNYQPWFEADVTAAARAAAAAGRKLTLGLFSNVAWPEFRKGSYDAAPAAIFFPDPDAEFGARVVASLDETGDAPALRLEWSPSPEPAEYSVERSEDGTAWKTVASGLSEASFLDRSAEPWTQYQYRVTARETASGETKSVVETVTLEARKTVMACADTYVRNGSANQDASFGTDASAVHRYSGADNDGSTREGFMRFDVTEMPERFSAATLKLDLAGPAGAPDNANGRLDLLEYPDFEWTDESAPSWNDVFGNGLATPKARAAQSDAKREAETLLGSWTCSEDGPLPVGSPVEFDVTAAVRAAKAAGKSHITLHTAVYATTAWNFGTVTRERAQGVSIAPRIEFDLKSWIAHPFVLVVR
ncbi:MAG: DNRLRE domain-containing protein [Kiritimatiellae bacterium]|nr:DNRLRE domain-containing protein [Kiritimatiellia bacterium]